MLRLARCHALSKELLCSKQLLIRKIKRFDLESETFKWDLHGYVH